MSANSAGVQLLRLTRNKPANRFACTDLAAYTGADTRLPLGKRANAAAAAQLRAEMGEMIEDVEMDVRDDDEEMREWEEAQIRRAGGARETEKKAGKDDGRKGVYRPAPSAFLLPSCRRDRWLTRHFRSTANVDPPLTGVYHFSPRRHALHPDNLSSARLVLTRALRKGATRPRHTGEGTAR